MENPTTIEMTEQLHFVEARGEVRILFAGHVIAKTKAALILWENHYPPVFYIPRQDVLMTQMRLSPSHTHCPYKGQASYYSLHVEEDEIADIAWSYETPFDGSEAISGYLAFYEQKGARIEHSDPLETPKRSAR